MADEPQTRPEISAAILKGVIVDSVLVAIGVALYFFTGQMAWMFGGLVLGMGVILLLLAQAGAFKRQ